jgi:hypothetical protein
MRSILYEFFPDGLCCWVKVASAGILLPERLSMHLPSVVVGSRCSCGLYRHTDSFDALPSFFVAVQVHGERREHSDEYPGR